MTKQEVAEMLAKADRIIAIRKHTLGITDTCPQCEEAKNV
jgi:hypothetical protein